MTPRLARSDVQVEGLLRAPLEASCPEGEVLLLVPLGVAGGLLRVRCPIALMSTEGGHVPALLVEARWNAGLVRCADSFVLDIHADIGVAALPSVAPVGTTEPLGLDNLELQLSCVEHLLALDALLHGRPFLKWRGLLGGKDPGCFHSQVAFAVHLGELLVMLSGHAHLGILHRKHVALCGLGQRTQGRQPALSEEVVRLAHVRVPDLQDDSLPDVQCVHQICVGCLLGGVRNGHVQSDGRCRRHVVAVVVRG
mmetsp:Transcript_34173/g.82032  ORF Transcript_34173/g.82032 Transcript_34173/m.82032 type:complete len:253 (-) Transcript_34173:1392-2150(-)